LLPGCRVDDMKYLEDIRFNSRMTKQTLKYDDMLTLSASTLSSLRALSRTAFSDGSELPDDDDEDDVIGIMREEERQIHLQEQRKYTFRHISSHWLSVLMKFIMHREVCRWVGHTLRCSILPAVQAWIHA
jgi:hypothetical protein